jgi:hypothetical protein
VSTGSKPLLSLVVVVRNAEYGVLGVDMKALEGQPFLFLIILGSQFSYHQFVHPSVKPPKA